MTAKKIIFLITPTATHAQDESLTKSEAESITEEIAEENHLLLPKAFARCGWSVTCATHSELSLGPRGIEIAGNPASHYDLIWPVGFGPKNGFLDRSALLASIESSRLISPISKQILHHGKSAWVEHCPETHISNNPNTLLKVLSAEQGAWAISSAVKSSWY